MFRDIISTIGARYLVAVLNLLLIFVNGKVLGREGMGMVGLIYASANLAVIFNSILCGNTIIYFMNRYNLRYVFYPACGWAIAGSAVSCGAMFFLNMLPEGYEPAVFVLAVLISLITAHSQMILGKDNVKGFNRAHLLQGILMFLALLYIYFVADYRHVNGYLTGLFLVNLVACAYTLILLLPHLWKRETAAVGGSFFKALKEMFVYGIWSGTDNLAEGLATRLNYFLVKSAGGYGSVGLLDSGTKMSESVWHISNSVSYIEYNSISKTADREKQKRVTLQLFKMTCCALTAVMTVIVCIPEWIFTRYLLTPEFAGIRKVIWGLSFGIVALGSNRVLSHYFIGSGNIRYSTFCSLFGLVILLIAGFILIPHFGVFGAALTSSIAYTGMLLFSLLVFMKKTGTFPYELLPSKEDWTVLRKNLQRRKNK
ncbi:MAG: polysaccharide biosynthesis C-terminal domain-containing protein [Tannerella sp.]|jgi:O-antigen/teichoic acid export membrane protein|nr:polysaccharide biosynthesis C-terminal domain-containing protein [Tannerella sp.]